MGVRGLFTYIQNYVDSALKWHKLCNCRLVIDGNNLAYELFNNSFGMNSAFGGDYDKYAAFVESFLRKLIQCQVETYIVMDGGQPVNREKFKTVYSRLNNQIYICLRIDPEKQKRMKIFPLLARSVFVSVAQRLGLNVLQADFEADDEIVVLAKRLNAFVLSNDSDFYLFDVPFILLNSVNFKYIQKEKKEGETSQKFIPCYQFDAEVFSEITNVREELLPLLAPILGNDFVNPSLLKKFYLEISFLRPGGHRISSRHKTIISVIKWLSAAKGNPVAVLNKVVHMVCGSMPSYRKRCMETAFFMYFPSYSALESWVVPHNPSCPVLTSETQLCSSAPKSISKVDFTQTNFMLPRLELELKCTCPERLNTGIVKGGQLPDWFVRAFRMNLIPPVVSDILNKKYMFTLPQVEMIRKTSVYLKMEPIVKRIRGILWTMAIHSCMIQHPPPKRCLKLRNNANGELQPSEGFFLALLDRSGQKSSKKRGGLLKGGLNRGTESDSESEGGSTSDSSEYFETFPEPLLEKKVNGSSTVKEINHDSDAKKQNSVEESVPPPFREVTTLTKECKSMENSLFPLGREVTIITEVCVSSNKNYLLSVDNEITMVTKESESLNKDAFMCPLSEGTLVVEESESSTKDFLLSPLNGVAMLTKECVSNEDSLLTPYSDVTIMTQKNDSSEDSVSPINEVTIAMKESDSSEDSLSPFNEVTMVTRENKSLPSSIIEGCMVTKMCDSSEDSLLRSFSELTLVTGENELPNKNSLFPQFSEGTMVTQGRDFIEGKADDGQKDDAASNLSSAGGQDEKTLKFKLPLPQQEEDESYGCRGDDSILQEKVKSLVNEESEVELKCDFDNGSGDELGDDDEEDYMSLDESDGCRGDDSILPEKVKSLVNEESEVELKCDFDNVLGDELSDDDEEDYMSLDESDGCRGDDSILPEKVKSLVNEETEVELKCDFDSGSGDELSDDDEEDNKPLEDEVSERELIRENVPFKYIKERKIIPAFRWYIRKGSDMCAFEYAQENMEEYKKFPSLFEIDRLSLSEREKIFNQIIDLDLELEEEVPANIKFILLCIAFWRLKYKDYVDKNTILSFLMCSLMFTVIDGKLGRKRAKNWFEYFESTAEKVSTLAESESRSHPSSMSLTALIEDLTFEECQLANLSLFQFHTINPAEKEKFYNRNLVHSFSEYQACIYFLQFVNSLLCFPYPPVTADSFWSGTFCYNIYKCFVKGSDLGVVLSSVLNKNDRIIHLFVRLYGLLEVPLRLPKVNRDICYNASKVYKKKLGIVKPSRMAAAVRKVKPTADSLPPAPEFDVIENPTEEDRLIMAENKFSPLLLS